MAERNNADSRHHLTVDPSRQQIPKDLQGSDNTIPLSPQWLLPNFGDNKLRIATGESHFSPHHGNRLESVKASRNGENFHEPGKRRNVYRPSLHDAETGCRDRGRDEERETNSAIRWREGDKELGDTCRTERWSDNSSKHSWDARSAPSERQNDLGNREGYLDQRRERKWNTRWGPDDKESDNWHEKWSESGREAEGSRDKGMPHLPSHGKDIDKEGEHYSRSRRSNSSMNRGRAEPSRSQSLTPNKQSPMFAYGRGRGGNGASFFPAGYGRVNSSTNTLSSGASRSYNLGIVSDKQDGAHGDPSTARYNRMKLLDIYRMTNINNYKMSLDGFIEVPSLTQSEPSEPLALSAPTPEELVILKGIDKGDIVSSSAPQVSKDGSVGRNSVDAVPSKQTKLGSREDLPTAGDDYKTDSSYFIKSEDSSSLENPSYEKHLHKDGPDPKIYLDQNNYPSQGSKLNAEASRSERTPLKKADEVTPWRCQSGDPHNWSSHDWKDLSTEGPRTCDMSWSHLQKDMETEQKNYTALTSSSYRDEPNWLNNQGYHSEMRSDSKMRRQLSKVLDREREADILHAREDPFISRDKSAARNFQPHPSPEELSLYYKDPQGQIQGPFSGSDLIGWFEAGYFGINLQVRHASAPANAPFSSLGDVMPHLRMKAQPPPGFGVAKQSDVLEVSSREKSSSPGNVHAGSDEYEFIKNGHGSRHGSASEAENRFISSSASEDLSLTEGMQCYGSGYMPLEGGESGSDANYLLAQRRLLERQKSLPNPLPFWSGRDSSSIASNMGMMLDTSIPHSKVLPPMGDASRQVSQSPQNVDLLSILHAAADNSPSPAVNSGVPAWSNFPDVMNVVQDKMDVHRNQHFTSHIGFGVQQQSLQAQNHLPFAQLVNQPGGLSSSLVPPEKLLSSDIPQDPQIFNLLQQQYLLAQLQMHSQVSVPSQLSLWDKILFFKQQQQQKQEQEQLLLQQQQQLLSQVLSGHQSHQSLGDPSYGQSHAAMPAGNAPVDHVGLRLALEARQINQQMLAHNLHDGHTSNIPNVNLEVTQDVSYSVSSGALPLNLPHQIFDHPVHSKERNSTPLQVVKNIPNSDTSSTPATAEGSPLSDAMQKFTVEISFPQKNFIDLENLATKQTVPSVPQPSESMASIRSESVGCCVSLEKGPRTSGFVTSISDQVHDLKISVDDIPVQCHTEPSVAIEVTDVEMPEAKKTSEKKSRKQKNSKSQSVSDLGKGPSKTIPCQQPKLHLQNDDAGSGLTKSEVHTETEKSHIGVSLGVGGENSFISTPEPVDSQHGQLSSSVPIISNDVEPVERKVERGDIETLALNAQTTSSHRAWKPAPGLKAKSLLEIQQEQQQRALTAKMASEIDAMVIPESAPLPTLLAGIVGNLEHKSSRDIVEGASITESILGKSNNILSSKSRKGQLHDLLAEEVLTKSYEGDTDLASDNKGSLLPSLSSTGALVDATTVHDDDFVEAKDTKKSHKKTSKAKSAGAKAHSPVGSTDRAASPITIDKSRTTHQAQQEKELLHVPPAGPSLGDFVPRKGDQANPAPAPAWSTDSGKLHKPTSLRDILREQEKKTLLVQQHIPIPTPAKVQSNSSSRGSGSSWQVTGSSPSKAPSPIQTTSFASALSKFTISKFTIEDDLFWGPLDQSKQKAKQSDFPSLANSSSWGVKSTPVKGAPGAASRRKKPSSSKPAEYTLSSSLASGLSFSKGRIEETAKHSEAMYFREWCESELVRLTGTNDTSFLEFCLKQPTSEAEMLLKENLGSLDCNHEFVGKLLSYKDFLSSDVIEMAFRAKNSREVMGDGMRHKKVDTVAVRGVDGDVEVGLDGAAKGGKKKGKKGKKVSPSVLGFNVVSNRIMMGEIQTADD